MPDPTKTRGQQIVDEWHSSFPEHGQDENWDYSSDLARRIDKALNPPSVPGKASFHEAEDGTFWITKDGFRLAHIDTFDPGSKEARDWAQRIVNGLNDEAPATANGEVQRLRNIEEFWLRMKDKLEDFVPAVMRFLMKELNEELDRETVAGKE